MDRPPPPPHSHSHSSSSSSTSFPILAISILGILATAILLLSYYLFIIKCCLNWRLRRSPFRSPSLRRHRLPVAGPVRPPAHDSRGLDNSAIRSIPTLRYTRSAKPKPKPKPVECAVCLAEFEDQELLRLLPGCGHSFHIDCIDTWLQSSANCPLCRFDVSRVPIHSYRPLPLSQVAVEVAADPPPPPTTTTTTPPKASKPRKFWQAASMGDECIDISREKDESFAVLPIRRSFSMDSSNDRALLLSVQAILQQNRELVLIGARRGEGSSGADGGGGGGNACGRIRRSFFSFGRSSRSATAVLPVQSELC